MVLLDEGLSAVDCWSRFELKTRPLDFDWHYSRLAELMGELAEDNLFTFMRNSLTALMLRMLPTYGFVFC